MASTVTTFGVFKTLIQRSVELDANLDTATKAAIRTRLQNLPQEQEIVLDQSKASSVGGNVSENTTTRSINVALGAPGSPNRVEFDAMSFFVPVRIEGTEGIGGFMPGHAGSSALPLVVQADITVQYRLASGDPWATFDRTTILDEVTWVQFAVVIAEQDANGSLPALHIHAEQV